MGTEFSKKTDIPSEQLSSSDDSRVRSVQNGEASTSEQSGANRVNEPTLDDLERERVAQIEREKRAIETSGRAYAQRYYKNARVNSESFSHLADFNEQETNVQSAEFYRFSSAEINKYGYF